MANLPPPPRVLRPWAVNFFAACCVLTIIALGFFALLGLHLLWPWLASAGPFWGHFWQAWVAVSTLLIDLFASSWLLHGFFKLRKPHLRITTALATLLADAADECYFGDTTAFTIFFALCAMALWPVVVVILAIVFYCQELHSTYIKPLIREAFTQPAPNHSES